MTQSKFSRPRKNLALVAMSFVLMFGTFLLPAYGQECDPSWFNPWAQSSAKTAHGSQAKAAKSQHSRTDAKAKSTSLSQNAKVHGKSSVKRAS